MEMLQQYIPGLDSGVRYTVTEAEWNAAFKMGNYTITSKNEDGTQTIGVTANGAFGVGASISGGITYDLKGNIGIAATYTSGGGFPSAGIGGFITTTDAPDIYKQRGLGAVVGASGGPGVIAIGGEYSLMADTETVDSYNGYTVSATIGLYPTPVEIHGEVGYTEVIGFNIFDPFIWFADAMLWIESGGK
jgi:hypothetical protein